MMDPNATLQRMFDAIRDGEWRAAEEAARELATWLDSGGFAPNWSAYTQELWRLVLGRRPKLGATRVRVDSQGYEDGWRYWGVGPSRYRVVLHIGAQEHELKVVFADGSAQAKRPFRDMTWQKLISLTDIR
jgi:hypothetical protein